jgi:hypothetical protein
LLFSLLPDSCLAEVVAAEAVLASLKLFLLAEAAEVAAAVV